MNARRASLRILYYNVLIFKVLLKNILISSIVYLNLRPDTFKNNLSFFKQRNKNRLTSLALVRDIEEFVILTNFQETTQKSNSCLKVKWGY